MKGVTKYEEFWSLPPRSIGEFPSRFKIPRHAALIGSAVHILYRSDKLNPGTGEDEGEIEYIHEHKAGVNFYFVDEEGPQKKVPTFLADAEVLILLGDCLGFAWKEGSEIFEEKTPRGLELYTVPSGKGLLVINAGGQWGKQRVRAMIWGGKLAVTWRGIVG